MIEAKKSLGQHWLNDENSLDLIVQAAQVKDNQLVVEIGPGTGHLTAKLLKITEHLIAVEIDESLLNKLTNRFKKEIENGYLVLKNTDIRRFDFNALEKDYKIVANIPYYLTSYLIRLISETDNQPLLAVLLIQKEVAQRLTEGPGKMSLLSIAAQLNFDVQTKEVVEAYLFEPAPKVDSQIVVLERKPKKMFDDIDYQDFLKFISNCFIMKRKKLTNNLFRFFDKKIVNQAFDKLKINKDVRPQDLDLNQWHDLFLILGKK